METPSENPTQPTQSKTNTMAIVALILAFFFAPVGLILGIIALSQIKKSNEGGRGLAIVAVIISLLFILLPLIAMAIIAGIAYMGVLNPGKMLPDRCQFPAGMDCIDKASITSDSITVALRNNMGSQILVENANSDECTGTAEVSLEGNMQAVPRTVENNQVFQLRLNGCGLRSGDKLDTMIEVTYTNTESGLSNTAVGDVRGRVV